VYPLLVSIYTDLYHFEIVKLPQFLPQFLP
jgi:hypothetical protein